MLFADGNFHERNRVGCRMAKFCTYQIKMPTEHANSGTGEAPGHVTIEVKSLVCAGGTHLGPPSPSELSVWFIMIVNVANLRISQETNF